MDYEEIFNDIQNKWFDFSKDLINGRVTNQIFKDNFGVNPEVCEYIWLKYLEIEKLCSEEELLWMFNFLRQYPTESIYLLVGINQQKL